MDRKDKILAGIDVRDRGLEIGPLASPIVSKTEGNVFYLDHLSTDDLKLKYKSHAINPEAIVEIDYVLAQGLSLPQLIQKTSYFDYVIASHVFEHIPNPIKWLYEVWEILAPAGKLSLAIPDKRFCFDYFRSVTTTGDLVEAYLNNAERPSTKAVFDAIQNAVSYRGSIAWGDSVDESCLTKMHTLEQAFALARASADGIYHDVHSWCFIPQTFFRILHDLIKLELFSFSVTCFYDTVGCEFYVTLKKESKGFIASDLLNNVPEWVMVAQ